MDDRQFDELSKHLSTGLSRKGILKLLGGVGAAGISAASVLLPAEAKKKRARNNKKNNNKDHDKNDNDNTAAEQPAQAEARKAKGKGKKGKGKKGKGKKGKNTQSAPQTQPVAQPNVQADSICGTGKVLICHKAGGSGNYTTNCVDDSAVCGGHGDHDGDCICQGTSKFCPGRGTLQTCSSDNVACGGTDGSGLVCTGCGSNKTACGVNCCTSSQKCCDGTCVEKSTLCGGVCGNVCKADETCCGSTCKVTATFCGGNCKTCNSDQKCCNNVCISKTKCCNDSDCPEQTCQEADCDNGDCEYTPVKDGDQGPKCTGAGQFCCDGKDCCKAGDICTGEGCCTPKTCAANYPGQCGTFSDGCGGDITCRCPEGQGCCDKICVAGDQCCASDECDDELCQIADCENGKCDYTPVKDGEQGPDCRGEGEFCCNGNDCCKPGDVCLKQEGCCTPKTCAANYPGQCGTFSDGCGGDITCRCPEGQGCCDKICVAGDQCCASDDCDDELCQIANCKDGDCNYTPVRDGQQGPECTGNGEFCCGGKNCCTEPEVCLASGECCTPKTCAADYPGQCGTFPQGCGLPDLNCGCGQGKTCCEGTCKPDSSFCGGVECLICGENQDCCAEDKICIPAGGCCGDNCPERICQTGECSEGTCNYTPVQDGQQGPDCRGEGDFCCNGNDCCKPGDVCLKQEGCCTPLTCKDIPEGTCGEDIDDGCGGKINCGCDDGETCCSGICKDNDDFCGGVACLICDDKQDCCTEEKICIPAGGCCGDNCPQQVCETGVCSEGTCNYTPTDNDEPGPLCDEDGQFCCNTDCCEAGDECTEQGCCTPKTCAVDYAGQCGTFSQGCGLPDLDCVCPTGEECNPEGICILIPGCIPVPIAEACSGLVCGPASNGCGVDYDCGVCGKKKKKGQRPIKQGCVAGVCKPFKKKRCFGSGLAGQKCSGKCKCANGRKCNNGKCCEGVGDGSRHCNSNSECCPGLVCAYRRPGQHRVCMQRNAKELTTESTATTAAPSVAIGAILTGLAATMGKKLTGNGEAASVAMDEVQIHALGPRD